MLPQRYNALSGAAQAAEASGDEESASLWVRRLRETAPGTESGPVQPQGSVAGSY